MPSGPQVLTMRQCGAIYLKTVTPQVVIWMAMSTRVREMFWRMTKSLQEGRCQAPAQDSMWQEEIQESSNKKVSFPQSGKGTLSPAGNELYQSSPWRMEGWDGGQEYELESQTDTGSWSYSTTLAKPQVCLHRTGGNPAPRMLVVEQWF